jgi:predicted house-cleaning noncanonical NTP pyrophosphatase (MazG superfamily)
LVVYNSEAFGISQKLVDDVKSYIEADETEDRRVKHIQKLLSFYEFNDIPLAKRPVGEIRVSEAVEPVLKCCAPMLAEDFCECVDEENLEDLIPELDKIEWTNEDSFTYKLFKIIDDNKLKDSDVYNAAGISKMVFSNLRKGVIPKKKTIFQLCLALPISISQATDLLASAGYAFILSNKFDKTIKKIIEAKNTTKLTRIDVIDLILYELGLPVFNSLS